MSYEILMGQVGNGVSTQITQMATNVSAITSSKAIANRDVGTLSLSTESRSDEQATTIKNTYNNLETSLKSMCENMKLSVENFQLAAATIGGMVAANPAALNNAKFRQPAAETMVMNSGVLGGSAVRPAVEAYDERDNRNAQMHTVVYNLMASRQDTFGETLFPTIVISPNEVGITVALKLFFVYNDFKRAANGALADYNRKNIMRAYRDMGILKNDLTKVIPVLRVDGDDKNIDKFVDLGVADGWNEDLGVGIQVPTAFLKVDQKIDLMGISQTNELLASGIMGPTDALDTYLRVEKLLVQVGEGADADVFELDVGTIPSSTFTYAPTGNYRKMIAVVDSDSAVLGMNTKKLKNNGDLTTLTELATHNARVQLNISGSVSLDKADCIVQNGSLSLVTLRNAAGQLVTGSVFTNLEAKLASASIIGYTLAAWRANVNFRQRGQLADQQTEYRVIAVPYRSPVGALSPAARNEGSDETPQLQTLVTMTGARVSNEAVLALQRWEVMQESYQAVATAAGTLPETTQVGSLFLIPTFMREKSNLPKSVDSLKSAERFSDIRGHLTEKIRYVANELLRRSEYMPVATVLTGNPGFKPTVIIATDNVIHNYLSVDGDLRLLGDQFDVKVVSTIAEPIKNKIYITFGVFDQSRNTTVNPLNSGNMLYSPETVLNLPIAREGQTSNELTVTPRFAHVVNCPVLGVIDVSGLPSVVDKVNVHTSEVI